MTNLYYGTIKQLLERISSVMIDREALQHLVGLVKEVRTSKLYFLYIAIEYSTGKFNKIL